VQEAAHVCHCVLIYHDPLAGTWPQSETFASMAFQGETLSQLKLCIQTPRSMYFLHCSHLQVEAEEVAQLQARVASLEDEASGLREALTGVEGDRERLRTQLARLKQQMIKEQVGGARNVFPRGGGGHSGRSWRTGRDQRRLQYRPGAGADVAREHPVQSKMKLQLRLPPDRYGFQSCGLPQE
jgi:hypothetical protein